MRLYPPPWRRFCAIAIGLLLTLWCCLGGAPAWADTVASSQHYRCDEATIIATLHSGAVDDATVPNSSAGTLPGAFVVLQGPGLSLQLPRTNNAGPPSFTDGKWWWSLEDRDHPRLLRRRGLGDLQSLACERVGETSGS